MNTPKKSKLQRFIRFSITVVGVSILQTIMAVVLIFASLKLIVDLSEAILFQGNLMLLLHPHTLLAFAALFVIGYIYARLENRAVRKTRYLNPL